MSLDDDLAAADRAAMPAVRRAPSRLAVPAGVAGLALLGAVTFTGLRADPAASALPAVAAGQGGSLPPPPVLAPVPVASPAPPVRVAVLPPPQAPLPPPPRQTGPTLLVDLSAPVAATIEADPAGPTGSPATAAKLGPDEAFAARIGGARTETVGTERLSSTSRVMPQGTIIAGVLETAINSDLPGMVRAVVSRDVAGFDGTTVLIPRGSRLIGQYSNGVALGQSRAFVIWTRMLRADGVSVQLGSAGTDALGTAGLSGKVDSHFLRRFGAAALLSVVTGGIDYLTNRSRDAQVLVGSSGQATQLAGIALQRDIDIPPTIKVPQGTPIRVFVARDLDFSGAAK